MSVLSDILKKGGEFVEEHIIGSPERRRRRRDAEKLSKEELEELRQLEESRVFEDPRFLSLLNKSRTGLRGDLVITPEIEQFIEQEYPQLLELESGAGIEGLDAQKRALEELEGIKDFGVDVDDTRFKALVDRAMRRGQREAQQRQQTLQQQFARRGQSGSGLEMASQIGGAAEAMDRAAEMGL